MSAVPTAAPTAGPAPLRRPAFDPEVADALERHAAVLVTSMTPEQVLEVRHRPPLVPDPTEEDLSRGGRYVVRTQAVPGPDGAPDVPLVLCLPTRTTGTTGTTGTRPAGPVPVLLYVHGGGLVAGNARRDLPAVLDLVEGLQGPDGAPLDVAVASVEHRLAPETRYPGPVEDCYAALVWLAAHAEEIGADPDRLLLAGVSAGGGLAAATALLARDRSGPVAVGQLLLCPMLDDRSATVSARQMAGVGVWDLLANATGWGAMLGEAAGSPDVPATAAPARAADLSGLPPAYVDVGSADTFRDEDVAYAGRIWADGGDAELHVWPGGCHGFEGLAPRSLLAQDAVAARRRWLRRVLGPRP